jgi:hypothetical protein
MRFERHFLFLFSIAAMLLLASIARGADSWQAGAAKTPITPEKPMWMAGYAARTAPASGKLTDLWAKALVLQDAKGQRAVLVTLDLVGINRDLSRKICTDLESRYKLERSQIAICTSHTHSGPVVGGNLASLHYRLLPPEQQRLIDEYAITLHDKIVAVVGKAIAAVAPAQLEWGSGTATFAVNRRENKEPDVPGLRAAGSLKGPNDHDVPVLAVKDNSGKLLAIACGYACHATVLSGYDWSGDYPGQAQMDLEKAHPGAIALFWAGCGADQNPVPRRQVELAVKYGKELATAVDKVLAGKLQPIAPQLLTSYAEIPLPLGKLPTRDELEADAKSSNKYLVARAQMLLGRLDKGESLSQTYPYPVQVWKLSKDVQWVFLGGEVVVDYALRIKAEHDGSKPWLAGYSNDVMAYIPSRRVLLEGGYEGGGAMIYYGLPTIWAPEVEETIVAEVNRQLK